MKHASIEIVAEILVDAEIPYDRIVSIDPYNGEGLLDFIPRTVSKAYALDWLLSFAALADCEKLSTPAIPATIWPP